MTEKAAASPQKNNRSVQDAQALRMRRLGMSFISHLVNVLVVVYAWLEGMIPATVFLIFFLSCLAINGVFALLINTGLNLKFTDPSMTLLQMIVAAVPNVYVMYFLIEGQARGIFLLIAVIPMLYGTLALKTRGFIFVGAWYYGLYCALIFVLWQVKPDTINWDVEFMQLGAYLLVIAEVTLIGGFVSSLRGKLRRRNDELADAMSQINELANTDSLTGVFNRRRLQTVIAEEAKRFNRSSSPLSVCMLDIDYFKNVNDTLGHHAGDVVLRTFAQTIASDLRSTDCFGRYGGEEFLLILPHTALNEAQLKAERIRQKTEKLHLDDDTGLPAKITLSAGVAEFQVGENSVQVLQRADRALYQAKAKGRNQVCVASVPVL